MKVIATSGDWLALGVPAGLPGYSGSTPGPGKVLLWKREAGLWQPRQVLESPDADVANSFGFRVTMDGGRLLASATSDPRRAVYAFRLEGETWVQDGQLVMPGPGEDFHSYGGHLLLSGNLAIVSASAGRIKPETLQDGWADIFERLPSGWVHRQRLRDTRSGVQGFGSSVAISGNTIFVTVPVENSYENSIDKLRGKVCAFTKSGSTWVRTYDIRPAVHRGLTSFGRWLKVTGGRLCIMDDATPPRVYEYSLTPPYKLLGELLTEVGPVDVQGDTAIVFNRDLGTSRIYRRVAGHGWQVAEDLGRERLLNNQAHEIHLNGPEILMTGKAPSSDDIQLRSITQSPLPQFYVTGQVVPRSETDGVTHLEADPASIGTDVNPLLTLSGYHGGTSPMTVAVTLSGDVEGFTLSSPQLPLPPLKTGSLNLRYQPKTTGEKHLTITLTPDTPGTSPKVYELTVLVEPKPLPPQIEYLSPPSLALQEDPPALQVVATGPGPLSYRWLRDGAVIPGETSDTHVPLKGGSYQVEVSSPHGKVRSAPVPVGLYSVPKPLVIALQGSSPQAKLTMSGPGIKVQWQRGGVDLQDGADYAGTRTPALTLKKVQQSSSVTARLTLKAGDQTLTAEAPVEVRVVIPPVITSSMDADPFILMGQPIHHMLFLQYENPTQAEVRFQVRGLPPGMTADIDGNITGTPTKAGHYKVQVTATVGEFTVSRICPLVVTLNSSFPPGIYWGTLSMPEDSSLPGVVVADLQISGAYSGYVQLGTSRFAIAGRLDPSSWTSAARPFPLKIDGHSMIFWLRANPATGTLELLLQSVTESSVRYQLADLGLIRPHNGSGAGDLAGTHNFGLLSRNADGKNVPMGSGFGTLKVLPDKRVTYTAQLADGSTLTGSTWLSDPPSGSYVYFYQVDPRTRSLLMGAAQLETDALVAGMLTWLRPPTPGRNYPAGFQTGEVEFVSSRYTAPASANAALLPGSGQQIQFIIPDIVLPTTPFTFTAQRRALFGKGDANPLKVKLDVQAPTGLLSGQFTLQDEDPVKPARLITRNVPYRGILLQEQGIGVGYFLLPTLPDPEATVRTTLATSPLVSGRVLIETAAP
ncbi:hypothetical protein BGE01nite_55860 [Brevifollis gellanilyticus]|uniref:Ig-like domain-containing protein n=2 Tax=Brevifollis gellanilyticus TaxID=748831 RepID=A0A512MHS8_9BACT|nr:hypothetical protein BGE01nite_55860 [Brevifollis gellanilyticus]